MAMETHGGHDWTIGLRGLFPDETVQACITHRRLTHSRDADERRRGTWAICTKMCFPYMTAKGAAQDIARLLSDPSQEVRVSACNLLAEMGDYGAPAVPELMSCMESCAKEMRHEAIRALASTAKHETEACKERAVEALERMLRKTSEPLTQAAAAHGLAELGAERARPLLEELVVDSKYPEARRAAALALGTIKGSPETLGRLLSSVAFEDRIAALEALAGIGEEASAQAEQVVQRLREPLLRRRALGALAVMGKGAEPHLLTIAGFLADPDASVRLAAAEALERLASFAGADVAEAAAEHLRHADPRVRAAGITALGVLGEEKAGWYVEAVTKLFLDDDLRRKGVNSPIPSWMKQPDCAAVHALPKLGRAGHRYAYKVAGLCLAASSVETRLQAMQACGAMGPVVAEQTKSLEDCLIEVDTAVVVEALTQLAKFYESGLSANTVKAMVKAVERMDDGDRAQGIMALGAPGAPEPVLQALAQWLEPKEDSVLWALSQMEAVAATEAIKKAWQVGDPNRRPAEVESYLQKALLNLLSAKDEGVRRAAVETIGTLRILKAADSVAEKLQDFYSVRKHACTALGNLAEFGHEHQREIAALLRSPLAALRQSACEALAALVDDGQSLFSETLEALQEIAADEIPCVRKAAVKTLECAM